MISFLPALMTPLENEILKYIYCICHTKRSKNSATRKLPIMKGQKNKNKNNLVSSFQFFFLFLISWPLHESKVYISHVFMQEFIVFKTS